jgi:hypothetical protein
MHWAGAQLVVSHVFVSIGHGHGGLHAHERCVAGSGGGGCGGLSTEAAWWTDSITTLVAVTV